MNIMRLGAPEEGQVQIFRYDPCTGDYYPGEIFEEEDQEHALEIVSGYNGARTNEYDDLYALYSHECELLSNDELATVNTSS